ncbi:type II secretion system protein GspG [Acidobacteriota bacterium]
MKKIQTVDTAKEQATRINLKAFQKEIVSFILMHGRSPENLKQLPQSAMLLIEDTDAWGIPVRYKRISDDSFQLFSAGSDREFGTADDIVLEY